ncbi:GNAT family N-acetyltransferase [Nocardia higoensis]|uniref:GNAT family N-acetyltransferase n=1 Tax=Nocardia higoensis TaxID=228599 RepID=UPI002B4B1356|nr:GNAT family N-acetyltransferase [Nocardia higoensis]
MPIDSDHSRTFETPGAADDLVTARLRLRRWTPDVAAEVAYGRRSPRWAEDFPADGDIVIATELSNHPSWYGPFGHRLIVEAATGLLVGSTGLFWPPADGMLEIGYGIAESRRGRGYATEAVAALTAHARTAPEVRTVFARVSTDNPASIAVLRACGYRATGSDGGILRYEA